MNSQKRAPQAMPALAWVLCALLFPAGLMAQQRHWVGGSGQWNDPAHWAAQAGGPGGAGVPNSTDAVIVAPEGGETTITIDRDARMGAMLVNGEKGAVVLRGSAKHIRVQGDMALRGGVVWDWAGTLELAGDAPAAHLDLRGITLPGDVRITSGTWSMRSNLVVHEGGRLDLRGGTLATNGNLLAAGHLAMAGQGARLVAGSSVVMLEGQLPPSLSPANLDPGTSILLVNGVPAEWGVGNAASGGERAQNICATDPGQTPFTIDAQLMSSYNGYGVSCHGACDGEVRVVVAGGVGPFIYSWVGGPSSATWTNVCQGNQIVIVTDQGQGVSCATNVQVTDPSLLSVIFYNVVPPACAGVCNGSATGFAVGGVPGYNYSWNNGAGTGATFNAMCPGDNTLLVTDINGCSFDTTFSYPIQPIEVELTLTDVQCANGCDGTASVVTTGGTGILTYDWAPGSPNGDGTQAVTGLCAGSYSLTIRDANGCDTLIQFEIMEPSPIIPNQTSTDASCGGTCNGSASVSPSGGSGTYTYAWVPEPGAGQGTSAVSGLCEGVYTVTIEDAVTGCDTVVTITIDAPPILVPNPSSTNVGCSGDCNGTATVAPSGGTTPYSYTWSPVPPSGQGEPTATGLCAGTWSVTIRDWANCDTTVVFLIEEPAPFDVVMVHTDETCGGYCDGTASVTVTGGQDPYTYEWGPDNPPGQGTASVSGLCIGMFSVLITDQNGCDTLVQVLIEAPEPLLLNGVQTDETCDGACDGTATVLVDAGQGPFTFHWTPEPPQGQGTPTASELCPGPWTVEVTDANLCTDGGTFEILAADPIQVSLAVTDASCNGDCDGEVVVTVSSGITDPVFTWSPVPGGLPDPHHATGLCPGDGEVTVTDAVTGCEVTLPFTIAEPPAIEANAAVTDPTCAGNCDGSIVVSPSGGTGTYTYDWTPVPTNGNGTAQATDLCAGDYAVVISSGGCDTTYHFTLQQPPPLDVALTVAPATCADACDGAGELTGTLAGLTFTWSPEPATGQGTPNATGFCAGSGMVTVSDAAGCDTVINFTIDAPDPITVDAVVEDASCGSNCDGRITLTVDGGTPGYTYHWTPDPGAGQGTATVTNLCPGDYAVTITDANGCEVTHSYTISRPAGIDASGVATMPTCANACDGGIILVTSGGIDPYTFNWSPEPGTGQGTSAVGGLCAGTWTVLITDQAGCDTTLTFQIVDPDPIDPRGTFTNESCNGPCDGTATVDPLGGAGGYGYNWSPEPGSGQGTASVSGLCAGDWCVTITDADGCETTWCFTIAPVAGIDASVTVSDGACWGDCDGEATVTATGGAGGFTYVWTPVPANGQGHETATGLCEGPVSVLITDAAGCDTTITFNIQNAPPIDPGLTVTPVICTMPCSGAASVFPTGGSGVFANYEWSPAPGSGQGTNMVSGLCAGTNYSVTITDSEGCDTTVTFTVPDDEPIQAVVNTTPATCWNTCDGTATVTGVTGGQGPYTYFWDPAPLGGQGTSQATGLCPGAYTVTVGDINGCTTLFSFTITAPDPIDPQAFITPINCGGDCSGAILLSSTGGNGGYGYVWTPEPGGGQGTAHAIQLCAGDWEVEITDAGGCVTTAQFTIDEAQPLEVTADVGLSQCGQCDGYIDVQVSGGVGSYTFQWGPPLSVVTNDGLMENLCAGVYPVTVIDASGCEESLVFAIADQDGEEITVTDGQVSCPGECDGTVSVSYNCSAPPCITAWVDLAGNHVATATNEITGLCAGGYIAIVINGSGCITMDTAYVTEPAPVTADISSVPVSCAGACDGSATINVVGGVGPFQYTWTPEPGGGQGTPQATGLCAGVYEVFVHDLGGCDATFSVLIVEPPAITVDATITDLSCAGDCNGSITLDVQGGSGTPGFLWTPQPGSGQGTASVTGLCADTWSVTIVDGNGCQTDLDYTLVDPAPITATVASTQSHCGVCDGTATISASGGTGPLTIEWSDANGPVGSGENIAGLCAGTYTATITDGNGCSIMETVPLTDVDAEVITVLDGQTLCDNSCDGMVSVSFTCGDDPCTITWSDLAGNVLGNTEELHDLCPGAYVVQVVNGNGCVAMDTAYVVPAQVIVPNLSTTPATCHNSCDGTATVGPAGGVLPYTYVWSPEPGGGQGTPQATGLCAGTHEVLITDGSGCATTVQVLITAPAPITVTAQVQQINCAGDDDGAIVLSPSGGAGLFSYFWDPVPPNGQGNNAALGIGPGDWTVTVMDFNNCEVTHTYTITAPDPISLSLATTASACSLCDGTATVTVSGGVPDYDITWLQNGTAIGTGGSIADLCGGLYTVRVTDANGCSVETAVPIGDADAEQLTTTDYMLGCAGDCDGIVSVDFTCSDPPCTIAWFDAAGNDLNGSGSTLTGLCEGLYLVQVTNAAGCITIDTAQVLAPDPIQANLSTVPESCPGACDGEATVGPSGGAGGYVFAWDINGTTFTDPAVTGLCQGTYSVEITDAVGCSITQTVLITSPEVVTATAVVGQISCNGACDGSIHVTAQGGTGPYTYQWSPEPNSGQGTNTATGLCAGTWTVTVTDDHGCTADYSITLNEPQALTVDLSHTDNACYNDCVATAQVVVTGGVAPYTIVWLDASGNQVAANVEDLQGLCGGQYEVVVTDFRGCSITTEFTIGSGDPIEAGLVFIGESCFGPCDGTASVDPSGGSGPGYSIVWGPGNPTGQGTQQISALCPGDYTVTITDLIGCDTTHAFTITPFQPIVPTASIQQVTCNGDCDGAISLATTGGAGTLAYTWTPEPGTGQGTASIGGLCPGDYTVTITDPAGCDTTATYSITEPLALLAEVDSVVKASCSAASDGAIYITVTGGVPGYTISWIGPNAYTSSDEDITGLAPGNYVLNVTDQNGCTFITIVTITAENALVADAGGDITECSGVWVTLDGTGSQGASTFAWTDGSGNTLGTSAVLDLGVLPDGDYTYILTVTNGPCVETDTVEVAIMPLPVADAGEDRFIYVEGTTVLGGSPAGPQGSAFFWQPDSLLDYHDIANPTATVDRTTWFYLTVIAPNGCVSTDSVLVTVVPEVTVPTGFTPNGDGYNDDWVLDFAQLFPDMEVRVFSRWGEPLFYSVGYAVPWDGRYDGKPVPMGTYYYVIELHDVRFPEPLTGPVTIIR